MAVSDGPGPVESSFEREERSETARKCQIPHERGALFAPGGPTAGALAGAAANSTTFAAASETMPSRPLDAPAASSSGGDRDGPADSFRMGSSARPVAELRDVRPDLQPYG